MKYLLICTAAFSAFSVQSAPMTVGIGASASSSLYNYKNKNFYSPVPVVSYQGDYFYINAPEVGVYLYNDDVNTISLLASYDPHEFDPKDAVNSLSKLSKRDATLFAGVGYSLNTGLGDFTTTVLLDTLGKSKGMKVDTSWSYTYTFNQWYLAPVVGVEWNNKKQNNYYYGVDREESIKSGVEMYQAKSSFTPYTGVNLGYKFDDNWDAAFFADATYTPKEQKESPLSSNKSVNYTTGFTVSYTF